MPSNADGTLGWVQNSDLFYLCGADQEETQLLLFPSHPDPKRREVLFLRETSELIAVWEGERLSKEKARELTGIQSVFWQSERGRVFREMMIEAQSVWLNSNEHLRASNEVSSRDERFVRELRESYPLHPFQRLAPLLTQLRMVKSPEEIAAIEVATAATVAGFERVLGFVKPGVGEWEIEAEWAHEFLWRRSRGFSYPPIIASGKNACVLHYVENGAICNDGELLLMDVAAQYANYHSDMTRTIPVNGQFTPRQKEVYSAVLRVLRACCALLKPGVVLKEYQKQAEKLMENELIGLGLLKDDERANEDEEKPAFKKYFMHGVSHHIGLETHDVSSVTIPLAPGMIVTVEPGIYIRDEGLAVRLENLIAIGETENLDLMAGVPLEIEEIENAMAARKE